MKKLLLIVLLVLPALIILAQNKTITGKVTDTEGKPVSFATVNVKGTTVSVSADVNGNFSIQAGANAVLAFSAAGFQSSEVNVGNKTTVNVLLPAQNVLSEVVVTALGIKRTDKALGYSVAKVDPTTLIQKSEPDVLKSLQGKVAGVDIRSSQGTPGAATRIQIRGNSSFFGDNQPLIVVDGVPYSNDQVTTSNQVIGGSAYSTGFSDLDPNDIASINILKGSSAAALYGSRASNGVLIITTKSGSAGRSKKGTEVTFSSSFSVEKIANLPEYQNDYGPGTQFGYANANGSWGPAFRSLDSIPAWASYRAAYPELFPSANMAFRAVPDNVKDLFQTGTVLENSIGLSGGDEKNAVSLTASQLTHNGYVEHSSYTRSSIGLGGSTKLSIGLNVRGNLSYSRSHQKGGFFGENQVDFGSQFARSLFLARNWDFTNLPFETKTGGNLIPNAGYDNPRWSAKYNRAITDEERFVAGVHADINLIKWINLSYNLGSNVNVLNRREIVEVGSTTASAEGVGRIVLDNFRSQEIESNLLVTFTPQIHKDFNVKLVIGNNINQQTTTRQDATGKNFITRGLYTLSNTSQQSFGVDFFQNGNFINADLFTRKRLMGVFGDATIGYKNYAFLELTGRNDWSSTLPIDHRSYFYPSVAGSFVFTDAFKIQNTVIDFGKIRAGWAKVGRDAAPYSLEDVYVLGTNFLGQSTASLGTTTFDPDLKPEFTQEIEVGTQLSFFKKRIDLDLSLYNRTSTNLIAPISIPSASGFSQLYTNYGKISNKGIEIDLTGVPVRTKNLTWSIRGAFTKNESVVKELTEGVDRLLLYPVLAGATNISPYLEPGKPFGYLRGDKVYRDSATGAILINPATGGMIVNLTDQEMIGDPNPDFKLGITNTLTYKGIFLSFLWDMTRGGDLYSTTVQSLLGRGVTKDTRDRESSWVIPGVYGDPQTGQTILSNGKPIPNQTRITTNDLYFSPNTGNGATFAINTASEWSVYDATVYRLREVTLGYEFPKSLFHKLPIGSATLTFTGRNLWYLAPDFPRYTRFDPEVNSFGATTTQGIELAAAPTTKRYGVNLRVTF